MPDERTARLQRLTVSSATHSLVFARDIDDDVDLCPDTPQAPSLIVAKAVSHLLDQPVLVIQDDIGQSRLKTNWGRLHKHAGAGRRTAVKASTVR